MDEKTLRRALALVPFLAAASCGGGGGGAGSSPTPPPPPPNQPPVAEIVAASDAVELGRTVLDGSTSSDPDGPIATFEWSQLSGPTITIVDPASPTTEITLPSVTASEQIEVQLRVTDSAGAASSASVTVQVHPDDDPTVAVQFPCADCRVVGEFISVRGTASSETGRQIVLAGDDLAVTVSTTAGSVVARPDDSGQWVAEDVPIPVDDDVEFAIVASDFQNRTATTQLRVENRITLTGGFFEVDPIVLDRVYVFERHHFLDRIVELNRSNAYRVIFEATDPSLDDRFGHVRTMSYDHVRNRLIILGSNTTNPIVGVDVATGATEVLSGADKGAGADFVGATAMDIDVDDNLAVVFDQTAVPQAMISVDLDTGDRSALTTPPATFSAMTVDAANDRFFIQLAELWQYDRGTDTWSNLPIASSAPIVDSLDYDPARSSILRIARLAGQISSFNLATNSNDILIDVSATTSGLLHPTHVRVDLVGDRYLVGDLSLGPNSFATSGNLYAIDPSTGDDQVWYDASRGNGIQIRDATNLSLDDDAGVLYLLSDQGQSLVRVALDTGDRSIVSGASTGSGQTFGSATDLTINVAQNLAYVSDRLLNAVLTVDLATGDRQLLSDAANGTGPAIDVPTALQFDAASGRLFLVNAGNGALLEVDPATGNRTSISDATSPGDPFDFPVGLSLELQNDRILVADETVQSERHVIYSVSISTGARTVVARRGVGAQARPFSSRDVQIDSDRGVVFAVGNGLVTRLESGSNGPVTLSDWETGNGEANWNLSKIAYSEDRQMLFGFDPNYGAVFAIDAVTGDRVVVSR